MSDDREQRLQKVLADYIKAVEAGEPPDRAALLASHPDLADDLHACFCNREELDRLSGLFRAESPVGSFPCAFGSYELLQELGRGGMGIVFKARDTKVGRIVALKMIHGGRLASREDKERFRIEVEATASLDHPLVVPIYEVGESGGQPYFTTKFMEGGSLDARLDEFRSDPRAAARLVASAARTVHHAHQRGLMHRDLKPANLLIDAEGRPHVTDFGLALRTDADKRLTTDGTVVGTASYMAPEQARGDRKLTTAVDIYALGAILYEILSGSVPFAGDSPVATLQLVLEKDPLAPSSLDPGVNRDLEKVCLKCLEKDPNRRYGSAEALAEDLERWLEGQPVVARPVGTAGRAWRWCRRHPAAAALAAVTALLSLGVLLAVLQGYSRAEAERRQLESSAQTVAKYFSDQWEAWGQTVTRTAANPELIRTLEHYEGLSSKSPLPSDPVLTAARAEIQLLLKKYQQEYKDPFRTRVTEDRVFYYPFDAWHAHDPNGVLLAHSMLPGDPIPTQTPGSVDWGQRDYIRGHGPFPRQGALYVSKLYESTVRYRLDKLAFSSPVFSLDAKPRLVGYLAASITTNADPGLRLLPKEFTAFVVGPAEGSAGGFKVILHPQYRHGAAAVKAQAPDLGRTRVTYPDPFDQERSYPTAFSKIGETPLIIVVQKKN